VVEFFYAQKQLDCFSAS